MNKEEIEKALKLFDRQDLINDVIEDLDTDIGIFMTVNQMMYYSELQQGNKQLIDNWNKLKEFAQEIFDNPSWASCGARYILEKMQELENGDNNE